MDGLQSLRSALRGCLDETVLPPAAQLERLRTFLEPVFARRYDAAGARLARPRPARAAGDPPTTTRGRFLSELTLDPPSSTGDLAGAAAPGRGLPGPVHDPLGEGARVGRRPRDPRRRRHDPQRHGHGDDDEIEEERRLLYVAMTRARDALHITFPMRYYRRPRGLEDPHSYAQLSRFLAPEGVRACFETIAPLADAPRADDGGRTSRARPTSTPSSPASGRSDGAPPLGRLRRHAPALPTPCCWISTTRSPGANGTGGRRRSPTSSASSSAEIGRAFDVTRPARSVGAYPDADRRPRRP